MDLLTAILACSLYRDDALVRAIAESNSHGNPYALVDATLAPDASEQPPAVHSLQAAVSAMDTVLEQSGQPLVGWMQIPTAWAPAFRKQPRDLFDPCTNVVIGTAKLSELAYECSRSPRPSSRRSKPLPPNLVDTKGARRCVVRKYALAVGMPDLELVVLLQLEHQRPLRYELSPISESPILSGEPLPIAADRSIGGVFFQTTINLDTGTPSSVLVDPFADQGPSKKASVSPSENRPSELSHGPPHPSTANQAHSPGGVLRNESSW